MCHQGPSIGGGNLHQVARQQLECEPRCNLRVQEHPEAFADPDHRAALDGYLIHGLGWLPRIFPGFGEGWGALNLRNRQRLIRLLVDEVVVEESKGTLRICLRDLDQIERPRAEVPA